MTMQFSRRSFISTATMSAFAVGLATEGVFPQSAEAQYATLLSFALSENPILAVVDLIELAYNKSTIQNAPTIADVVSRIDGLSQSLKANFEDLQRQFRLLVDDALKQNDLRQDTMELAALSYSLNIATARGGAQSEIMSLSGGIDRVARRLGFYGLAGSLAYINAIALQNSVHRMLQSPPRVVVEVNKPHEQRLGHIIYDGKESDSLE